MNELIPKDEDQLIEFYLTVGDILADNDPEKFLSVVATGEPDLK